MKFKTNRILLATGLLFSLTSSVPRLSLAAKAPVQDEVHAASWYSDFEVEAGAHWGFGKMGSSTSVPNRNMNTLTLQALPGYRFKNNFLLGPYFEYRFVGQNTDPSDPSNQNLNNQNIKGTGYLVGAGFSYNSLPITFSAAFTFLGEYSLAKQDTSGLFIDYQKPIGFHFMMGYMVYKKISADLKFSTVSYAEDEVGTVKSDVSTNKRTQWDLALGGTLHFDMH